MPDPATFKLVQHLSQRHDPVSSTSVIAPCAFCPGVQSASSVISVAR
jgi:hypothetical protein